ncbi:hypothetical protein DPMN_062549 [Dreissena polymorpha]|uniref:Uncharacterized protein n=1 Tax=Dreissena polymorpha TaxID=45954 RepID=A0A9D4C9X4_DREPO|nr:hypothetical protein DPMN_062549 [Dreissena polymorpha]
MKKRGCVIEKIDCELQPKEMNHTVVVSVVKKRKVVLAVMLFAAERFLGIRPRYPDASEVCITTINIF